MVGTILPIVHGEQLQGKRPVTLWLYALGNLLGAIALGAVAGGLGYAVAGLATSALPSAISVSLTGALGLIYSLRDVQLVPIPAPQFRKQVPAKWRMTLPIRLTALLYGIGLGIGFATFVTASTLYVVVGWAMLTASPLLGALALAIFGLGRSLPMFMLGNRDVETNFRLTMILSGWQPLVLLLNGLALSLTGAYLLVSGLVLWLG